MIKYSYLALVLLTACDSSTRGKTPMEAEMFLKQPAPTNYVISSPLEGVLTKGGKPLANTRILRKLKWNGNEDGLEQEFVTDEQGRFSLPAHEETLSLGPLDQFVGHTYIDVPLDEELHELWTSAKLTGELNSEYDSPPSDVICDIDADQVRVPLNLAPCLTRCRWTNMPEDDPNEL